MSEAVMICDPDQSFLKSLDQCLRLRGLDVTGVSNQRVIQQEVKKKNYGYVFLSVDENLALTIKMLEFLKLNAKNLSVVFMYSDFALKAAKVTPDDLRNLFVDYVIDKTKLDHEIEEIFGPKTDHSFEAKELPCESESKTISDSKFTTITLEELAFSNKSIFDLYLRLSKNKYLKILHKGEVFSQSQLQKYLKNGLNCFYFKTQDRLLYVNNVNEFIKKRLNKTNPDLVKITALTNKIFDSYVDAVHLEGLNGELMEEGKKICENFYKTLSKDKRLGSFLKQFEALDPANISHAFLTSVFASSIVLRLDWGSKISSNFVVQGALLHDIGKLKVPKNLLNKELEQMSDNEKEVYKQHPEQSLEILDEVGMSQQVKLIAYQHHEYINGEGYPNRLTGIKIFPLAKIVTLASDFSVYILKRKLAPLEGLRQFMLNGDTIQRYDAQCVRKFIKCFSNY